METSRKRFCSESDIGGNKRKTRKSKRLLTSEDGDDACSIDINLGQENRNQINTSPIISSHLVNTSMDTYSEKDDINIINHFRKNMHMLKLKDEPSTYHALKTDSTSSKSMQNRFVNHILPNLFKYNIMSDSELIDFYDAAQLEVPDEFVQIASKREATSVQSNECNSSIDTRNTQTTTSLLAALNPNEIDIIPVANTSTLTNTSISVQNNECNSSVDTCNTRKMTSLSTAVNPNEIEIPVPSTSRQADNEIEIPVPSTSRQADNEIEVEASTSEEKCIKFILNYIQITNSNGTNVFIPDTEPDIPSIENRLLNEFGIRKESVKIIPKERFQLLVKLKNLLDGYDKLVYEVLKNRIHDSKFIERMLPDARILSEYLSPFMARSKRPLQRVSPGISSNIGSKIIIRDSHDSSSSSNETNDTNSLDATYCSEVEMNNDGPIINSLSDCFDHVSISSIETQENNNQPNNYSINIKTEPIDQEVLEENEVRSPYFTDHAYCKNIATTSNAPQTEATEATEESLENGENNLENNAMDFESNLIEHACMPQIMFSKRSKDKIFKEHINVNHLLVGLQDNCDEHNSNNNETDNSSKE